MPKEYEEIPQRNEAADDEFLFKQGPTGGLGKIQFHDYNNALDLFDLPNINLFKKQVSVFKESLIKAPATEAQMKDIDVMLTIGEMFTLIPYAQLILENCKIMKIDEILIDQIFDFIVRDFSKFALEMYSRPSSTPSQMEYCLKMIQKPEVDSTRTKTIWKDYVYTNVDVYEMNP
jgi:acyl-CoA dehydrogenase